MIHTKSKRFKRVPVEVVWAGISLKGSQVKSLSAGKVRWVEQSTDRISFLLAGKDKDIIHRARLLMTASQIRRLTALTGRPGHHIEVGKVSRPGRYLKAEIMAYRLVRQGREDVTRTRKKAQAEVERWAA